MHEGSCHCGAVRLVLPSTPAVATDCNCSLCRRIGGPWVYFKLGTVEITGHPESTAEYVWGDRTLRTIHCRVCGCVTHWEPLQPTADAKHGVNLGNFSPELIASVRGRRFDGADTWEFIDPAIDTSGPRRSGPRIAPIEPPYPPKLQAEFDKVMRGAPPLLLFRTVARNPRVLQRFFAGGLLDRGSISLRLRELMILRTCALCEAEYEWGVHVATFAEKALLTSEQVAASARGTPDDGCWAPQERAVLRLADDLHRSSSVSDAVWQEVAGHFSAEQLIELVMLAGLYHAVSFMVNAFGVSHEASAPRFPGAA